MPSFLQNDEYALLGCPVLVDRGKQNGMQVRDLSIYLTAGGENPPPRLPMTPEEEDYQRRMLAHIDDNGPDPGPATLNAHDMALSLALEHTARRFKAYFDAAADAAELVATFEAFRLDLLADLNTRFGEPGVREYRRFWVGNWEPSVETLMGMAPPTAH